MGFFSWNTSDTDEEIFNHWTEKFKTVYMYLPDGRKIKEESYDGHGIFGGIHVHNVLEEFNPKQVGPGDAPFTNLTEVEFPPKFSFSSDKKYEDLAKPKQAENQGYVWSNEDEDV